jgi:hypothetical protein
VRRLDRRARVVGRQELIHVQSLASITGFCAKQTNDVAVSYLGYGSRC